ncbi:MAG: S-methyl-5'-thioinosine phosphorylase [Gammaproteobacteria bacterium]|nr:S-methyl-5'-thioinosine phosphorylase [Gammaproteobacteria bacterium]
MSVAQVGVIVGTGFSSLLAHSETLPDVDTPYGPASSAPTAGLLADTPVIVLARHGQPHRLAPHAVNYRANIWLLHALGVRHVLATNTVGGISREAAPGVIVIPDQLIDYTWGREHSFMDANRLEHVDFSQPYTQAARSALLTAARSHFASVLDGGVYGCTQGPRLESAAEIERMARDGCSVVGMTGDAGGRARAGTRHDVWRRLPGGESSRCRTVGAPIDGSDGGCRGALRGADGCSSGAGCCAGRAIARLTQPAAAAAISTKAWGGATGSIRINTPKAG